MKARAYRPLDQFSATLSYRDQSTYGTTSSTSGRQLRVAYRAGVLIRIDPLVGM